jgi:hypothetical protein
METYGRLRRADAEFVGCAICLPKARELRDYVDALRPVWTFRWHGLGRGRSSSRDTSTEGLTGVRAARGYHFTSDNPAICGKLRVSRVATRDPVAMAVAAMSKSCAPTGRPVVASCAHSRAWTRVTTRSNGMTATVASTCSTNASRRARWAGLAAR